MPLIPIVSGYLLFSRRKSIFNEIRSALALGIAVAAMGTALYAVRSSYMACAVHIDALALTTLSALTIWIGGFITLFGTRAFLSASFSLLFLVFLIPIPSFLLQRIVKYLQIASTEVAHGLFWLTGVPFLTDGSSFHLPRISVAVAEQCCGIRSSISLFITGVMASHLFLKTGWGRSLLILSVLPITVFKNALRILTLALLAVYVDQRVLESALHRAGGIPFFGLALLLFGCVLLVLRRTEVRRARRDLRERV